MGVGQQIAALTMSAFSEDAQHQRLLRLAFPKNDGPHAILLPNTLHAHEAISRGFRFEVELLSDDARIPLKAMMARMVTISLVRAGGSLRYFNGYVTEFRFLRADGGFAFYQMVLEPFLAFARLRQDNVSFHGKTVRQITEATLAHYRQADWHMHSYEDDPVLSVANQHNETDYNHLHRRWEARGLHYWYEHREDGHTLMLSDNSLLAEPIDADRHYDADVIAWHAESGSREDAGIYRWSPVRRLGSGGTTLASFDYKNPTPQFADFDSLNRQGDFYPYEIYENTGAYGFPSRADGEQLAAQKMAARDHATQTFDAESNDRTVQPGRAFKLGGHFSAEDRSREHDPEPRASIENRNYLILTVDHEASNNYQAGNKAPSHYSNTFTCTRRDIRWRPGRYFHSAPCPDPGVQTAIVVGPAGEEIHTDGLGRVKLQFHWDRLGKHDENSSPWVRVMTPGAGGEFGQIRLPRVGEEVVVVFVDGNIDHPLIMGSVYNGKQAPPWNLPEQRALSGLRSRELGGGKRSNHLVLDDTPGKIQAQLKSDHQCSQLSLGQFANIGGFARVPTKRGEGWELTTSGWGVARASKGILISTEDLPTPDSAAKNLGGTLNRLESAVTIHDQLAALATEHDTTERSHQAKVLDDINAQVSAIRGSADMHQSELTEPHLLLASRAGLEISTSQAVHIASDRSTAITSGQSVSIASAAALLVNVGSALRIFVHKAGIKLSAASGKIFFKAHSDDIEIIANKVVDLLSETDWINVRGKKGIRLHGGNNMLEIGENVQFFTAAPVIFNGNLETRSAKTISQAFNEHSHGIRFDQEINLVDADNKPVDKVPFEIMRDDGTIISGKTAKDGKTGIQKSPTLEGYTIRWKGNLP